MIEVNIENMTCDGCGALYEISVPYGDMTFAEIRKDARGAGWRNKGKLDYCRACVEDGTMKQGRNDFGTGKWKPDTTGG